MGLIKEIKDFKGFKGFKVLKLKMFAQMTSL